jgi:hypothetical protein
MSVPPPLPTLAEAVKRLRQPSHRPGHKEGPLLPLDLLARVVGHPPPFKGDDIPLIKAALRKRREEADLVRPSVQRRLALEKKRREKEEEEELNRYGVNLQKSVQAPAYRSVPAGGEGGASITTNGGGGDNGSGDGTVPRRVRHRPVHGPNVY